MGGPKKAKTSAGLYFRITAVFSFPPTGDFFFFVVDVGGELVALLLFAINACIQTTRPASKTVERMNEEKPIQEKVFFFFGSGVEAEKSERNDDGDDNAKRGRVLCTPPLPPLVQIEPKSTPASAAVAAAEPARISKTEKTSLAVGVSSPAAAAADRVNAGINTFSIWMNVKDSDKNAAFPK